MADVTQQGELDRQSRLSLLDRHEREHIRPGRNQARGGVLPVAHHDAAAVGAVVEQVGALALGVGGALLHALPEPVGGRVGQHVLEPLVDAVRALHLVLDAVDRDVAAADARAGGGGFDDDGRLGGGGGFRGVGLRAAVALVAHAGAAAPALAGDGVHLELLARVAAVALLGGLVEAEALSGRAALALAAGQVRRVRQPRRAAVVHARGPVGARDQLGRAAEAQRGGGRVGQVPGQVGVVRAAAALGRAGVVLPLEGVEAAAAFEGGDGVGGEDALGYVLELEGFWRELSLCLHFPSHSIRLGRSWGLCKVPSSSPCSQELCRFPWVLAVY
ncbi:hypothetical protein PG991_003041 [Apiospora marii]|uniref:Uncharacterized protein n=1 Tax=Apiospora marii TaxID=335849 RepID=A0ABR1SH25_9PEZI